jgi:hypothetical protein
MKGAAAVLPLLQAAALLVMHCIRNINRLQYMHVRKRVHSILQSSYICMLPAAVQLRHGSKHSKTQLPALPAML